MKRKKGSKEVVEDCAGGASSEADLISDIDASSAEASSFNNTGGATGGGGGAELDVEIVDEDEYFEDPNCDSDDCNSRPKKVTKGRYYRSTFVQNYNNKIPSVMDRDRPTILFVATVQPSVIELSGTYSASSRAIQGVSIQRPKKSFITVFHSQVPTKAYNNIKLLAASCNYYFYLHSLESEAHDIRKTSSDTNLSRFRLGVSGPKADKNGGGGRASGSRRRLSAGSRACGKITGQVKKQIKSVKGHLGAAPKQPVQHNQQQLGPEQVPPAAKGKSLLSGLKKPFKQIKKQISEKSSSNVSSTSEEPSPTAFQKKPSLTKSLKDFKDSLTAGVATAGANGGELLW